MKRWLYGVAGCVGAIFCTQIALAAGSEMDILLKKLQEKGILSAEEATGIAAETKKVAAAETKETAAKASELPDWIKNTKFKGDLRFRYESGEKNDDLNGPRQRERFRLRAGLETTITDGLSVGFGLSTAMSGSDTTSAPFIKKPGGDPRSQNQTFQDAFSRKDVWIDYAYARYAPTKWFTLMGGKFANPIWQPSDMLITTDMNLEGAALRLKPKLTDSIGLIFNAGYFILDENGNTGGNPLAYVLQPGIKWNMTKDTFIRFSTAYYRFNVIKNRSALDWSAGSNTFINNNVTKTSKYKFDYNAYNLGGEVGFNNPFNTPLLPYLSVFGGYLHNPDPSTNNDGYLMGVFAGSTDVKKFKDWSFEYTFRRIEKDAWLDIFPDSSFYGGKTNAMGHRVKILFGLAKNTALGFNYYNTWNITGNSKTENLVQGDIIFKF